MAAEERSEKFAIGRKFSASMTITGVDFSAYISFARTRNLLFEDSELVAKGCIEDTLVPGRV